MVCSYIPESNIAGVTAKKQEGTSELSTRSVLQVDIIHGLYQKNRNYVQSRVQHEAR